jgi:hypothetical protein
MDGTVHWNGLQLTKFCSLKRFSKDIRPHIVSGAVAKIIFTCLVVMLNEEIFGLDVLCLFGARCFKGKSAHVVPENNIGRYHVALCFKEMTCQEDIAQFIIHCNKLGFCGTFVLSFCLINELVIAPAPKARMAPVWPQQPSLIWCEASTYQWRIERDPAERMSLR